MLNTDINRGRLFGGVFFVALSTLLYEVSLTRMLSFTIWHHFAYVVLSTALLGFGAAGAFLAVRTDLGKKGLAGTLSTLTLAASFSGAAFVGVISAFPFDPMKIFASGRDFGLLFAYQLGATVPFFFSGLAISLALRAATIEVGVLYFWDLAGAAMGCATAVFLMNSFTPAGAALAACAVFALSSAVFKPRAQLALATTALLVVASLFSSRIPFTPAASKHLSQHLSVDKMTPVFTRWTALFRTDVVEKLSSETPLPQVYEWGLSRRVTYPVQRMKMFVTHDGSAGTPIYDLRQGNLDFMNEHILKTPYLVAVDKPKVLVIGVGGGRDLITAWKFGASDITGVEIDPVTIELVSKKYSPLSKGLFKWPNVHLVAGEGRHFVEHSNQKYDVIQLTGVDTLASQSSGAYVLAENYLYTTEAVYSYLNHLNPRGVLSLGIGDWQPDVPQSVGRMLLVIRKALLERGIQQPERHIIALSSLHLIAEIVVRSEPFAAEEIVKISKEATRLGFVPLVLGGADAHPLYAKLMRAEDTERTRLLATLPYVLDPVTDDDPFFFRFFRWSELLSRDPLSPVHTSALGQLVLLVLLASLTVLGIFFILVPLVSFRLRGLPVGKTTLGLIAYFAALGAGFMFFEISFIQKFVLYLGYPTYALTVVLFSLLISLGLGSYVSKYWESRDGAALVSATVALAGLVLLYRFFLPVLQQATLGFSLPFRVAFSVALLAPAGVLLGTFFPLGIRRAAAINPDLIPWAWGINGCASVTGSVLAILLAMGYGFTVVWSIAVVIYALGVSALLLTSPLRSRRKSEETEDKNVPVSLPVPLPDKRLCVSGIKREQYS
jgi:hypothetical protein